MVRTVLAVLLALQQCACQYENRRDGAKFAAFDSVRGVADAGGATLRLGPAVKHGAPLLRGDREWEPRIDNGYPNALYDRALKKYRLWYDCCVKVADASICRRSDLTGTLYAESDDGVRWRKPDLGLVAWPPGGGSASSRANNVVLLGTHGLGVFEDTNPATPKSRRFKAVGRMHGGGGGTLTSRDGLRWSRPRPAEWRPAPRWDTHSNAFWDRSRKVYALFARGPSAGDGAALNRTLARAEARSWGGPYSRSRIVSAGAVKTEQVYAQLVFPFYSAYLGLVVRYDGDAAFDKDGGIKRAKDKSRCQLAWSPDTKKWFPLVGKGGQADLIPLGKRGSPDAYDCYPSKPIADPETKATKIFYFGGDGPHFGARNSTLLLATLPPDGFAGLAAGQRTARKVTTHPLRCGGRAPVLTATVAGRGGGGGGRIRARVLRADGKTPVKGLGFDASKPVLRDAVDEPLAWRPSVGAAPVPEVCVLQFEIRDAVLYTFGFAATQRAPAAPAPPPGEWVALRRLALGVLRLWTVLAATTLSALAARSAAARACACLGSTRRKAGGAS